MAINIYDGPCWFHDGYSKDIRAAYINLCGKCRCKYFQDETIEEAYRISVLHADSTFRLTMTPLEFYERMLSSSAT